MNAKAILLPMSGLLMLFAAALAGAGWSAAAGNGGQAFPLHDAERLIALAGNWVQEEELQLTVTYRGLQEGSACESVPHGCALLLRQSGLGPEQMKLALDWAVREGERLSKAGAQGAWYVNVQGWMKDGSSALAIWEELDARYTTADRYEDAGSRSASYTAEEFQASVRIGDQTVQLQAAVHRDTELQKLRVTLGTPLILIEY